MRTAGSYSLGIVSIGLLLISCTPVQTAPPTPIPAAATATPTLVPPIATPTAMLRTPTSALTPTSPLEPTSCVMHYSNPALGFAVEYPCGWEVTTTTPSANDPLGRPYEVVEFVSDLYAGGEQVFGRYTITVAVCLSAGAETITDTVEYALSPLSQTIRDQLKRRYLTVSAEPAMELTSFPWERFGSRKIWVVHDELEYTFSFRPHMDFYTPSDTKARTAFDAFLRTFTFIPITETPSWQIPTPTPVPTPTSLPSTENPVRVSGNPVCAGVPSTATLAQSPWLTTRQPPHLLTRLGQLTESSAKGERGKLGAEKPSAPSWRL